MDREALRTRPKDHEWLLDEKTCIITQRAFDSLAKYNSTFPTGSQIGKVWKRNKEDPYNLDEGPGWLLGEYTEHPRGRGFVMIVWRDIIVI